MPLACFSLDSVHDGQCSELYSIILILDVVGFGLIYHTAEHTGADSLVNGLEGKNLLSALTAFVTAIVNSSMDAQKFKGKFP